MRDLTTIARVCHEANRALQITQGDPAVSPPWDEAPDWQREAAIAGVTAALDGATPEQLHYAWCTERINAGWRYGPVKDAETLTHPCLVPYGDLPEGQRDKDRVFLAIVRALTGSRLA